MKTSTYNWQSDSAAKLQKNKWHKGLSHSRMWFRPLYGASKNGRMYRSNSNQNKIEDDTKSPPSYSDQT